MEKQNYFSKISKIGRVITLVLCLTLLVFNVTRPIVVSANTAVGQQTMINIASNYQDVIQVAPYLLPIILLLVAVGWWWDNSEDLADKAMEIYNNGSVALRNWANGIAQEIIDGSSAFKLTKTAATEINKQLGANNQIPDDKKYIMLPPDLLSLRNADPSEILMADTLSAIEDSNELLTENNTLISTGNGLLGNIQSTISTGINSLRDKLSSFYTQVGDGLTTINNNMMKRLDGINTTINETKSALAYRIDGVKAAIQNNMYSVVTAVNEFKESLIYRFETLMSKIDILIAKSDAAVADPGQVPPIGESKDGQKKIPIMIGKSKDLLSKYSAAFLAIAAMLTKFIELPVIGDLVQFGLALGVFALVVNLANQISAADDRKGAKSRPTRPKRVAKGG